MVCMTEPACLSSSSSTDYNPPSNDMDILNSINFTPVSSDVSLGESYETSEDKNVGDISVELLLFSRTLHMTRVGDEFSCCTAVAELEAGIHGLHVIV
ncbi:hypothetical protein Tco_1442997 [Tanacetum coccineum]